MTGVKFQEFMNAGLTEVEGNPDLVHGMKQALEKAGPVTRNEQTASFSVGAGAAMTNVFKPD